MLWQRRNYWICVLLVVVYVCVFTVYFVLHLRIWKYDLDVSRLCRNEILEHILSLGLENVCYCTVRAASTIFDATNSSSFSSSFPLKAPEPKVWRVKSFWGATCRALRKQLPHLNMYVCDAFRARLPFFFGLVSLLVHLRLQVQTFFRWSSLGGLSWPVASHLCSRSFKLTVTREKR